MKIIDNFISDEEAATIKNYIFDNEKKVNIKFYNWLASKTCGSILIPKLTKEFPNLHVRLWANILRKGEGIGLHNHGESLKLSGNLYLDGAEGNKTYYVGREPIDNKIGTLVIFDPLLDHWVEPNESNIPRVSVAFDTTNIIPDYTYPPHPFIPLGDA